MEFVNLKKILLKELLLSKKVFILGHNNLDLDAFASILGFSLICKKMRKTYYLVSDDKDFDYGINKALEKLKSVGFINKEEAEKLVDDKSLIIVFDTNKNRLICLNELSKARSVIVVDHHDTNNDTIKTPYLFINKTVSSASEIVVMLLNEFKVRVPKFYCTLLLSGIILDTNGLSYKLNRKTFYNCYFLLSKGADMNESQELLKENINDYFRKHKLIEKTVIENDVALIIDKSNRFYSRKDLAITADTLLTFQGVKTSVVVAKLGKNDIGISARSIGKVDVNDLMNNFGGGGNKNEGAATINDMSFELVEKKILELIKR